MAIAQEQPAQKASTFNWRKIILPISVFLVVIFFMGPVSGRY
jgi:hypothetical protein